MKINQEKEIPERILNFPENTKEEKNNTLFDLKKRVLPFDNKKKNDIIVEFDGTQLANINFNFIAQLSEVLSNDKELEVGEFQYQIFKVNINKLKTYEEENIVCEH